MAKKKKADRADSSEAGPIPPQLSPSFSNPSTTSSKPPEPSTSSLIICRNKHWRYISSFHGPWLQLPPEVLESLAHSNYFSPRPRPVDPAVFYDLVKIRRAVDDATSLAVRAASGLTSAALNNSMNAGNGMLGGAAALGLGYGGGGGNGKMSRETKHRMREMATQKLSQAYHLDEIAASVATMQSTSTLEDVAQHVLKRQNSSLDAKYVHFFHEKIPSRMMAQCTPLDTLNDIIAERPTDGSPYRTRALTRIFKEDYIGAARDLTEGLAVARYWAAQHRQGKDQLILAREAQEQIGRDWRQEVKVKEEDQPCSLETQMLFHRAGAYFTIACQHVHDALNGLKDAETARKNREASMAAGAEPLPQSAAEKEAHRRRLEARKLVKTNAKRALRDYNNFIGRFDYTPGIPFHIAEEFFHHVNNVPNGMNSQNSSHGQYDQFESTKFQASSNGATHALVPHKKGSHQNGSNGYGSWPQLPTPEIFSLSQLFSPSPPASLPPFPSASQQLARPSSLSGAGAVTAAAFAESQESVTYHPLLTDALHSLLLCHALIQTPPKELLRHAHNVARIARVCDGYPIFLAARSPARADWIEVVRRAGNWIGITQSWEALCRPAPLPGHGSSEVTNGHGGTKCKQETQAQRRERQKQEAIFEALADERVVDEDTFQRAVRARERRAREDEELDRQAASSSSTSPSPGLTPKRWAQDGGKEYPISTDRAEAIARWVREAPLTVEGSKGKKTKKSKAKSRKDEVGLEESIGTLSIEGDLAEEEVD